MKSLKNNVGCFLKGKSKSNTNFILRVVIERLYLCFIDYAEAFGRVGYEDMIWKVEKFNGIGKDMRIIRNM